MCVWAARAAGAGFWGSLGDKGAVNKVGRRQGGQDDPASSGQVTKDVTNHVWENSMRVLLTSLTFSKREFPGVVQGKKTVASRHSRSPELRVWGRRKARNGVGATCPSPCCLGLAGCSKPVHLAGQVWETLSPLPEPQANEGGTVRGGPLGWPEVSRIPAGLVPKGRGPRCLGGKAHSAAAGPRGPAQHLRKGRSVLITLQ